MLNRTKCKIESCNNQCILEYCYECVEKKLIEKSKYEQNLHNDSDFIFESEEFKKQMQKFRNSMARDILKNAEDEILYGFGGCKSICTLVTWNKGSALYNESGKLIQSYNYVEDSDSIEIVLQSNLKPVDTKIIPSLSETFKSHIYLQDYQELFVEPKTIFGEELDLDDEDYYDDW
ncbi:MAG: hypothetical protein QQN41_01390 [Nitrosopumilus sp.]